MSATDRDPGETPQDEAPQDGPPVRAGAPRGYAVAIGLFLAALVLRAIWRPGTIVQSLLIVACLLGAWALFIVGRAFLQQAPDIWKSLRKDKGALLGMGLILLVVLMAACANLAPYGPSEMDWDASLDADAPTVLPPSSKHWLGTDRTTYDVFSRLLYGARLSLLTGIAAVLLALFVGVPLGALSGYAGGRVDSVIMRGVDIMLAFPSIVLAIAIATILDQRSVTTVIVAVGVVNIPTIARQVRASVLQVKTQEFVLAAQAMGMKPVRILTKHVLPNCLAPIIVLSTLGVGYAILSAAGLNFLGLGPEPTVAEWGVMLTDGYSYVLQDQQWVVIPPGAAIAITVLGFNLLGDGLRKALDPRAR